MKDELEKLVAAGKISRHHVEPLVKLAQCGYCMHRSWGFGRITNVDTVFSRFTIDFPTKPGHSMDLAFAAESLKPISPDHILARKAADLASLREMAAIHHLELIRLVLESFGGKATVEQIQQALVPDVITEDWRKWWDAAKREMKKDGHFYVPLKKNDAVVYQAKETTIQERLLADFRAAKGLKARLIQAHELIKSIHDLDNPQAVVKEVLATLNTEIASHQRTQPALALEAIFVRDEVRQTAGIEPQEGAVSAGQVWGQNLPLGQMIEPMPSAKFKQALQSFQQANPEHWAEVVLDALNTLSTKLCGEAAQLLIQGGHLDQLKELLARLISQHHAGSNLLLWLAKERTDAFADILGPEVFRAMLTAIERDQFNEKKSNRLRDYILDDQDLLVELIESADMEVIKDLTRTLQLSPSFDDMDKRSLFARIVKHFPAIQPLISGEQHARQESNLIVSWESLERRKTEYNELVHRKIPANSREIAQARSYGDLSENHEYKAAKEMQKLLMRRKAELENLLERARGTDFLNVRTEAVSVGTRVKVTDLQTMHQESFAILGAWDFDVEKGIISYLSPMAQALLNRKAGEEVQFEMDGATKRYRVDTIEAYRTSPSQTVAA
ncbi:MAG: GreA/GreB family elongation factor [Candidatus Omnitrophica bacterium]|nr:GreA/GreB family elongation factor [Candidatus Omnitrophota bacterium]